MAKSEFSNSDSELYGLHPGFHCIIPFMLFLGLLSDSRSTRALIFISILISFTYMLLYTSVPKPASPLFNLMAQTVLRASDALLINNINSFRRIGKKQETNHLGLWDRMKRAFHFLCSFRLVGWNHEPRHVLPPRPSDSRWQFVLSRIARCLWYIAIFDVAQTVLKYIPRDGWRGTSITAIEYRLLYTSAFAVTSWCALIIPYTAISIVAVGTGISEASQWPAFFGKWSDAYTVRRFWGRSWHQCLRRVVTVHGDLMTYQILGLPKDSFVGINVHRFVAFALSGAIHTAGDYASIRSGIWQEQTSMSFFVLQAVAITFEQIIGKLFGINPGKWTKRAGYIWTFLWFTVTFPPWVESQYRYGVGKPPGAWEYGSGMNWVFTGHWTYE